MKKSEIEPVRLVALELNKVLGLEPAIDIENDIDFVKEQCWEAAKLVAPEDKFTTKTASWLRGVKQVEDKEAKEKENAAKPKKTAKPKKSKEKGVKNPDDKKQKPPVKAGGVGVIASILEFITDVGEDGIGTDSILERLVVRFPERSADSMRNTIDLAAGGKKGGKLSKREGVTIKKVDGVFFRV